ncbi:hypothetical protein [Streptomyces chattanoogensis]|uniref:hypothetical protein n=1 Tax=Streptomyces chattanoogensis TaxID=66876 RepID=UPI0036A68034
MAFFAPVTVCAEGFGDPRMDDAVSGVVIGEQFGRFEELAPRADQFDVGWW